MTVNIAEIEDWCKKHNVEDYEVTPEGIINAGNTFLGRKPITLPYKFGTIGGSFQAVLVGPDLTNCPDSVSGSFSVSGIGIVSLKGGPKEVGDCYIHHTSITSLEYMPKKMLRFSCTDSKITDPVNYRFVLYSEIKYELKVSSPTISKILNKYKNIANSNRGKIPAIINKLKTYNDIPLSKNFSEITWKELREKTKFIRKTIENTICEIAYTNKYKFSMTLKTVVIFGDKKLNTIVSKLKAMLDANNIKNVTYQILKDIDGFSYIIIKIEPDNPVYESINNSSITENVDISKIKEICEKYEENGYIYGTYQILPEGSVNAKDVRFPPNIEMIPKIKFNVVDTYHIRMPGPTIEMAPNYVNKELIISNSNITSLKGLPEGSYFLNCSDTLITNLEGLPSTITGISCRNTNITDPYEYRRILYCDIQNGNIDVRSKSIEQILKTAVGNKAKIASAIVALKKLDKEKYSSEINTRKQKAQAHIQSLPDLTAKSKVIKQAFVDAGYNVSAITPFRGGKSFGVGGYLPSSIPLPEIQKQFNEIKDFCKKQNFKNVEVKIYKSSSHSFGAEIRVIIRPD